MTAIQPMREYVAHQQWTGRVGDYQRRAQQIYISENHAMFVPWAHVNTVCDTPMCLNAECMDLLMPRRAAYPEGVCVYCGDPAGTMDHLMPKAWTGDAQRRHVMIVPACGSCNSTINDSWAISVSARRAIAHERLRTRNAVLLAEKHVPDVELLTFGHTLRTAIHARNNKRKLMRLRLAWPSDPEYDLRAFQLAGIEDPEKLGLI